jgi:hypothetical protein
MAKQKTKIKTLDIRAKEWFDQKWGNSYFSVEYSVDGSDWIYIPMRGGYDDQYRQAVIEDLVKKGLLPNDPEETIAYWELSRDMGVTVNASKIEVKREGDL